MTPVLRWQASARLTTTISILPGFVAPSPARPLVRCRPQFTATEAAIEAAGVVQVTGHRVFLVEVPGFRPCYCVQEGAGPDFESAVPQ
jgi:hypothetical protein